MSGAIVKVAEAMSVADEVVFLLKEIVVHMGWQFCKAVLWLVD